MHQNIINMINSIPVQTRTALVAGIRAMHPPSNIMNFIARALGNPPSLDGVQQLSHLTAHETINLISNMFAAIPLNIKKDLVTAMRGVDTHGHQSTQIVLSNTIQMLNNPKAVRTLEARIREKVLPDEIKVIYVEIYKQIVPKVAHIVSKIPVGGETIGDILNHIKPYVNQMENSFSSQTAAIVHTLYKAMGGGTLNSKKPVHTDRHLDNYAQKLLDQENEIRKNNGLPDLKIDRSEKAGTKVWYHLPSALELKNKMKHPPLRPGDYSMLCDLYKTKDILKTIKHNCPSHPEIKEIRYQLGITKDRIDEVQHIILNGSPISEEEANVLESMRNPDSNIDELVKQYV